MRKLAAVLLLCSSSVVARAAVSKDVAAFIKYDQAVIALAHVRVIDGTGAPAMSDQTIVIRGGKIESIRPASDPVPEGAEVIDLTGHSVLPGLVGMHDHMYYPAPRVNTGAKEGMYPEHASSFPKLYLAGGVTSIRTTGSVEPYADLEIKHAIDSGNAAGPKMHISGPYLEGPGTFALQMHQLTGPDDARRTVEYWIAEGATSFKAYMFITRAELKAAIDTAHAHGLKVTGHLCSVGFTEAADLGIDDLEHGLVVDTEFTPGKQVDTCPPTAPARDALVKLDEKGPEIQSLIRHLIEKHVAVTSTLPVFETFVPGRAPNDPRVLDAMLPEARQEYLATREKTAAAKSSAWPNLFAKEMAFEHDFAKAGGLLLAGLDPTGFGGVIPGYGDQREVELLVEAGFTPLEAIRIATFNGAKFLGEEASIGSIAPGKAADLDVVKGDPSTNIKDIENVAIVFKDGTGYDPAKLTEASKGTVGLR
ncbi:MAG TPA: amidohydrolase family protein [Thermoanaerobaculia bacterium]